MCELETVKDRIIYLDNAATTFPKPRSGLHCAPLLHETLGTYRQGGIRFNLGPFNTQEDIDRAVAAITAMARSHET